MRVEGTDFREERMEQPERVFPNHQIKFHELKFNLSEKKKKKIKRNSEKYGEMWNIEVRSKLTNPPKLRSANQVSNVSPSSPPSREGNCELNRNAFPPTLPSPHS